jgi:acylglycerol lipase
MVFVTGLRPALSLLTCCLLGACMPRVQTTANVSEEPRLEESRAMMPDGARLPLSSWLPSSGAPRAVVLALHGLNDHAGSFATTGEYLAGLGVAVYAFDQRGFGGAPQRGIWAGGGVMAEDAWQVARLLRAEHPGVPFYGLGESLGGAVLLHALQQYSPGWMDGAALLAPAVWNRREMHWYERLPLRLLAHSWRGMKVSARSVGRTPSDDPDTLRELHEDPLVLQRTRVDVLWGISELMDAVTTAPTDVGVPLLILYGGHDEIMPPAPMCAWLMTSSAARPQFAFYPNSWHLLTRGREAPLVHEDLAAWFERPGEPLPSAMDAGAPIDRLCVAPAARGLAGRASKE